MSSKFDWSRRLSSIQITSLCFQGLTVRKSDQARSGKEMRREVRLLIQNFTNSHLVLRHVAKPNCRRSLKTAFISGAGVIHKVLYVWTKGIQNQFISRGLSGHSPEKKQPTRSSTAFSHSWSTRPPWSYNTGRRWGRPRITFSHWFWTGPMIIKSLLTRIKGGGTL